MERDLSKALQYRQLMQAVSALHELRDSLVLLSLALHDWVAATPSLASDEVLLDVERYLNRIREKSRTEFD